MCGICGKLSFKSQIIPRELIHAMNEKLMHRGPDEDGFYFDNNFGMGMRRLKIIDLSTGSQPLYNETKDIAVILNGEIYNYLELRKDLEEKAHTFKTSSDTETIVHAYEQYGLDFATHLNGMFAFALWDSKQKRLLLVRDRMGIKPLYYRADAHGISFASEIKSLLVDPECTREIDYSALDDYFSLMYVPGPRSIYKAIKKLEPGHMLICDGSKKTITQQRYWTINFQAVPDYGWDFYKEKLDSLLQDAVKIQMRSDVPFGLFLSSGLDSGSLCYYASKVSSKKLKTFTVFFNEKSYSEQAGAKAIGERCGTEHHEILLKPAIEETILKINNFFDEPFADPSAIPTYTLCEYTRKNITVALGGEGGDELFAGYPTFLATEWARYYRMAPKSLRKIFSRCVNALPVSWENVSLDRKIKTFIRGAENPYERSHFAWYETFKPEEKEKIYSPSMKNNLNGHDSYESFQTYFNEIKNGTNLEKLLYVQQRTLLLDEFLVKSDRMSMAHSLEVRVPILDHRIVEFATTLPARYKIRGTTLKWTLRKLMEGRLPASILTGKKMGFYPPVPSWISGSLRPFIENVLSKKNLEKTGLVEYEGVRQLLEEHNHKVRDNHRRLWTLLNFVLWQKKWG